mmetsp:Transcript_40290/g.94029  ORF Transcript_40290/g.94029 Transcript_40290/m.94029 type:complete len:243 (-) Transcript_40290:131-859(-)
MFLGPRSCTHDTMRGFRNAKPLCKRQVAENHPLMQNHTPKIGETRTKRRLRLTGLNSSRRLRMRQRKRVHECNKQPKMDEQHVSSHAEPGAHMLPQRPPELQRDAVDNDSNVIRDFGDIDGNRVWVRHMTMQQLPKNACDCRSRGGGVGLCVAVGRYFEAHALCRLNGALERFPPVRLRVEPEAQRRTLTQQCIDLCTLTCECRRRCLGTLAAALVQPPTRNTSQSCHCGCCRRRCIQRRQM